MTLSNRSPKMYPNNPKSDTQRFGGRTLFTFNPKS